MRFQETSIVHSSSTFPQTYQFRKGVYCSEDKQARHLISFDPANFEISKIYQGNLQSLCRLAQLFLGSHFTEKERNRWRNFYPALEMQFGQIY